MKCKIKMYIVPESHRKMPFLSGFISFSHSPFGHKEIANGTLQAGSHYIRIDDKVINFAWFRRGQGEYWKFQMDVEDWHSAQDTQCNLQCNMEAWKVIRERHMCSSHE